MENSYADAAEPEQTVLIIFMEKYLFKSKLNIIETMHFSAFIYILYFKSLPQYTVNKISGLMELLKVPGGIAECLNYFPN